MKHAKVRTLWDARNERLAAEFNPSREAQLRNAAELNAYVIAHPEIGILTRNGQLVYYVNNPYREARDPRQLGDAP